MRMKSVMLVCGAVIMASAVVAQADWPRYMGPKSDGISTDKIIKAFPEGKANVLWSVDTGEGFGGAAISAGKVYILDRYHGDNKEVFRCFDLNTGKEEWKHEYTTAAYKGSYQGSRSTPTVDGDMAYTVGVLGDLIAFDLKGKKVAWQKNVGKDFGARAGGWGFAQSPLVHGDKLIISGAGSANGAIALDKKTGEPVWRSAGFGRQDTYTSPLVTMIGGEEHLLVWNRGAMSGLDPKDGKTRWVYEWRSDRPIPNPVPVGDGRIYLTIGYGGGSRMLDVKKDGEGYKVNELWAKEQGGSKVSPAILYKNHVYTISETKGTLQCIDLNGDVKWGKEGFSMGGLLIVDDTLVVVDGDGGTVHLIDPSPTEYKELSKAQVLKGKDIWAPLAISDSKLVVRDQHTIKCVDLGVK